MPAPPDRRARSQPRHRRQAPPLPYGVGEVVKMYQGGINKDVIINYINSTALPYHLTADGVIYLQTLGMPQEITKTMILRDGQLQQQQLAMQQFYQQQQQPMPAPAPASIWPCARPTASAGGCDSHNATTCRHSRWFGLSGFL